MLLVGDPVGGWCAPNCTHPCTQAILCALNVNHVFAASLPKCNLKSHLRAAGAPRLRGCLRLVPGCITFTHGRVCRDRTEEMKAAAGPGGSRDRSGGRVHELELVLPAGSYAYKFIVDGGWTARTHPPASRQATHSQIPACSRAEGRRHLGNRRFRRTALSISSQGGPCKGSSISEPVLLLSVANNQRCFSRL